MKQDVYDTARRLQIQDAATLNRREFCVMILGTSGQRS